MLPRERFEELEANLLAPAAACSRDATRRRGEAPSSVRTAFQRDRDRIIHSQSFRRLKSKTQVFLPPAGDHVRTRLTHTLEVTQISRTIARALRLNEDLTEAIALGHDLGHTPFGHAGERALAEVFPDFRHNEQSLRIVDYLEKDSRGLNLTRQVRDGILRHSKPDASLTGALTARPETAEAQVVKISDGIAYINHDLDDAIRAGMLTINDVPGIALDRLGTSHSERIDTLVVSVIQSSMPFVDQPVSGRQVISIDSDVLEAADGLRNFLFEAVYAPINELSGTKQAGNIVRELFGYFVEHPDELPVDVGSGTESDSVERLAADFISGMTDQYANRLYSELFISGLKEA